jgi:DNA invertase Pin-like site-specific DNA recombinase
LLSGQGASIDTTTAAGRLIFGIFAALAEFERELIRERTLAGLQSAKARGRKGGRRFQLSKAQVKLAQVSMQNKDTPISDLCKELKVSRQTLYRYLSPEGELRDYANQVLRI